MSGLYYEVEGKEWEVYETLEGAVEQALDLTVPVPRSLRLTEYAPRDISIDAAMVVMEEALEEHWSEEYGDGDGTYHPPRLDPAALRALVTLWAAKAVAWRCEPTGRVLTVTRAERPDLWPSP